jgi:hypothetical protein
MIKHRYLPTKANGSTAYKGFNCGNTGAVNGLPGGEIIAAIDNKIRQGNLAS